MQVTIINMKHNLEGLYRIRESNYYIDKTGNVYSNFNRAGRAKVPVRLLAPNLRNGYPSVRMNIGEGKMKHYTIHRLMAEVFLPYVEDMNQVNHINGIKTDNRVENLEWCNASLNMIHAYKNGLMVAPGNRRGFKGELSSNSIPVLKLDLGGGVLKRYINLTSCKEDGFRPSSVSKNCKGFTDAYKGYKWMFEEAKYKLESVCVKL